MSDQIDLARASKDEVIAGLWMGGGWLPRGLLEEFAVVCLCAPEVYPDDEDLADVAFVVRCPLRDSIPTDSEIQTARAGAAWVARCIAQQERALVTCLGGLNRSGLVVGLALRLLGHDAAEAIRLVKRARGPFALSNKHFIEEIRR